MAITGDYKSVEVPLKRFQIYAARLTVRTDRVRVQVFITVQRGRGEGRNATDWVDSVVDIAIEPDLGI